MKVSLNKDCGKQLRMCDLKDGDLAVVLDNTHHREYAGKIIHVLENTAICIGQDSIKSWSNRARVTLTVRRLESGETLILG